MKTFITIALLAFAGAAFAQASPVGLWKTIDDETKTEKSLVRITENGGVLNGKIEKLLDPSKQDSKCDKCEGARKDQPINGMTIVEGVKKNADEPYWDGGKSMEVRGFIAFLYRNQTWQRVE